MRPAHVPQVGFRFLPSTPTNARERVMGGDGRPDELAEWVEETFSFCDEGDGGGFTSGDDEGVTFVEVGFCADFDWFDGWG